MIRDYDGIYFAVKRKGVLMNVCFTDLTEDELAEQTKDRSAEWWKCVALHLADIVRNMGDVLTANGLMGDGGDD